jgi:hypothetical protein
MRPIESKVCLPDFGQKKVDLHIRLLYSIYVYFVIRNREGRKECLVGTD